MTPAERTAAALAGIDGRVRSALDAPDSVLSQQSKLVDPTSGATLELAADLMATVRAAAGCVGLAAPQVGVGQRVFAMDVTGHPKAVTCHGGLVLCNAELVQASRWRPGREGCLSVPHLTADVKRATRVVVTGQLPGSVETVTVTTDAFEARALQHELDHCAGWLFLDRVAGAHAVHPRKVYG